MPRITGRITETEILIRFLLLPHIVASEIPIPDGHSRMTAAYMYYLKTGNTLYIDMLLDNARYQYVNPLEYGYKKTNLWK